MKKFLAILLTMSFIFTLGIPAFADDEEQYQPPINQEEILDSDTSEAPEETPEESPEINEDETFEEEEEEKTPLTDEEIEQLRKDEALLVFEDVKQTLLSSLTGTVLLPLVPVMIIIPVFGWVTSAAAITAPFLLISVPFKFIAACIEAIDIYTNFDASEYQSFML